MSEQKSTITAGPSAEPGTTNVRLLGATPQPTDAYAAEMKRADERKAKKESTSTGCSHKNQNDAHGAYKESSREEASAHGAPESEYQCVTPDVRLGVNVRLSRFINLYGCEVGDESKIGAFVEIQKNAKVGRRCKISSHTFVCEGVTIEDCVFIGHGVTFVNDTYPRATSATGELKAQQDWKVERTLVKRGASIGSGATILSNVVIGENAIVGAGSVVTRDVEANVIVTGNPARVIRYISTKPGAGREHV